MKTRAIHGRVSRVVENLSCPLRVVWISCDRAVIGPALHGQNTGRGLCKTSPKIPEDRPTIDGKGECLPYAHILRNRIAHIEGHVLKNGSWSAKHLQF